MPAAICPEPVAMESELVRTCETTSTRLLCIAARDCSSRPVSSRDELTCTSRRSPLATRSATCIAWERGFVIDAVIRQARSVPIAIAAAIITVTCKRALEYVALAEAYALSPPRA